MSGCADLIGRPYRLGADGTGADGAIDCIHMVYVALADIGIPTPMFNPNWYEASWRAITRDLLLWGKRVSKAAYDGDIILLKQDRRAFAVAWSQGAFYVNEQQAKVTWCRLEALPDHYAFRYCPTNAI
jgi:hypothetical protein